MLKVDWSIDATVMAELGVRLAHARLKRNATQAQVAREAGVSKRTVERLESGVSVQLSSLLRVLRALGLTPRLDALLPPPAPSPMERLRGTGHPKRRARTAANEGESTLWTWDDDA